MSTLVLLRAHPIILERLLNFLTKKQKPKDFRIAYKGYILLGAMLSLNVFMCQGRISLKPEFYDKICMTPQESHANRSGFAL